MQIVQPELQPFAIVNAVAPDSPAKEAVSYFESATQCFAFRIYPLCGSSRAKQGLFKDDKFLRFGSVHAGNHQKLQALNEVVAQNENVSVT